MGYRLISKAEHSMQQKRAELVRRARELGRLLADETQPEQFAAPLRKELADVNARIDAIDGK